MHLRGGGQFSLEARVGCVCMCVCWGGGSECVTVRAKRAGASVRQRRRAGCVPRGGPGWALWRLRRGGLVQRGLVGK